MKFALLNNQRVEPFPGGEATCSICESPVISKCGSIRIHHWAHENLEECDRWAEGETEWHRAWKNNFPTDWQECIQYDLQTGEKHIADVRTAHGLAIEFQHSALDPNERATRENFYQNMIWIVDGTRLKRDFHRFNEGRSNFKPVIKGFFYVPHPEEYFPLAWLESSKLVFFDFWNEDTNEPKETMRVPLWCLFPGRAEGCAVFAGVSREDLIAAASNGPHIFRSPAHEFVDQIARLIRDIRQRGSRQLSPQRSGWNPRQPRSRRF